MTAQHDREVNVAAFLDLTLGEWEAWLTRPEDDPTGSYAETPTAVEVLVANVIEALQARRADVLAIAQMADETLAWFVTNVPAKKEG